MPPCNEAALAAAAAGTGVPLSRIGTFLAGPPIVTVRATDGARMPLAAGGWSHFG